MDVRAGSLMRYGRSESVIGDVVFLQIAKQPDAFGLIGVERDIDASGVIETERGVYRCLSIGADRDHAAERDQIGRRDFVEIGTGEGAVAIEAGIHLACPV